MSKAKSMATATAEKMTVYERPARAAADSREPQKAQPCNLSRKTIEDIAELFADSGGYKPTLSLEDVVGRFGGTLKTTDDFRDLTTGSIVVRGETDFTIKIPTFASASRDRFTIAHELGHLVLHYLWPKHSDTDFGPIYASRYGGNDANDDLAETEANWFAAAFLMPGAKTEALWKEVKSVTAIASEFNVDPETARLRLQSLGIGA